MVLKEEKKVEEKSESDNDWEEDLEGLTEKIVGDETKNIPTKEESSDEEPQQMQATNV